MSLLPALNAARSDNNNPEYYFSLNGGALGPVTDSAFVATGTAGGAGGSFVADAQGASAGSFTAKGNGTAPLPTTNFNLNQSAGTPVFSMGLINVPTGVGNVGNDFAISRYDDNGGYQGAELTITRSNGTVAVANGLTVGSDANIGGNLEVVGDLSGATLNVSGAAQLNTSLEVGTSTTVGGGLLEIEGTLGLSRVYDGVYNPPQTGAGTLLFTGIADGVTPGVVQPPFTPTISGTYILSLTIQAYAPLFVWTPGTSALLYGLVYNAGANIVSGGQLYCPLITNPAGMGALTPGLGAGLVEYQNDIIVDLVAGTAYTIIALSTAPVSLGTGGNVAVSATQLFA
jgi:hypothetical protein